MIDGDWACKFVLKMDKINQAEIQLQGRAAAKFNIYGLIDQKCTAFIEDPDSYQKAVVIDSGFFKVWHHMENDRQNCAVLLKFMSRYLEAKTHPLTIFHQDISKVAACSLIKNFYEQILEGRAGFN